MPEDKKEQKEFVVVQVPTQHTIAIQTPDGELMTTEQAIAELLNNVQKLVKALG